MVLEGYLAGFLFPDVMVKVPFGAGVGAPLKGYFQGSFKGTGSPKP